MCVYVCLLLTYNGSYSRTQDAKKNSAMTEVKPAVELDEQPAPAGGWFCCAAP